MLTSRLAYKKHMELMLASDHKKVSQIKVATVVSVAGKTQPSPQMLLSSSIAVSYNNLITLHLYLADTDPTQYL